MTRWDVQFGRGKVNVVTDDAGHGVSTRRRGVNAEARPGEVGLAWIQNHLASYDLSLIESIRIERGRSKKAVGVYGKCFFPTQANPRYRVTCMIPGPFPCKIHIRKPPLYMNEDGTFPPTPRGCRRGVLCIDRRSDRRWYRIIGLTELMDLDEAIVWIMAHEAFHYLRRTRQIPGRNNEIQADAYGDDMLAQFQSQRDVLTRHLQKNGTAAAAVSPVNTNESNKPKPKPKRVVKKKTTKRTKPQPSLTATSVPPKTLPTKPPAGTSTRGQSDAQVKATARNVAGSLLKAVGLWMGLWAQPPVSQTRTTKRNKQRTKQRITTRKR